MGTLSDNGGRGQQAAPHIIITVTDRDKVLLQLSGSYPSLDYALNMLDQARRELEAQWRLQRAQAVVQAAQDAQLAADLMRTR